MDFLQLFSYFYDMFYIKLPFILEEFSCLCAYLFFFYSLSLHFTRALPLVKKTVLKICTN